MNVPFFDYPKLYISHKLKFDQIFSQIAKRGSFIMQDELEKFEKNCPIT